MITLIDCANFLEDAPHGLALLEAWQRWQGDDLLPSSDAVIAEHLGSALGYVTVFDAFAPERIIIRLFAGWHEEISDHDLPGRNYIDMASEERRPTRIKRVWDLASTPCGGLDDVVIVKPCRRPDWPEMPL